MPQGPGNAKHQRGYKVARKIGVIQRGGEPVWEEWILSSRFEAFDQVAEWVDGGYETKIVQTAEKGGPRPMPSDRVDDHLPQRPKLIEPDEIRDELAAHGYAEDRLGVNSVVNVPVRGRLMTLVKRYDGFWMERPESRAPAEGSKPELRETGIEHRSRWRIHRWRADRGGDLVAGTGRFDTLDGAKLRAFARDRIEDTLTGQMYEVVAPLRGDGERTLKLVEPDPPLDDVEQVITVASELAPASTRQLLTEIRLRGLTGGGGIDVTAGLAEVMDGLLGMLSREVLEYRRGS